MGEGKWIKNTLQVQLTTTHYKWEIRDWLKYGKIPKLGPKQAGSTTHSWDEKGSLEGEGSLKN